jgi:hypothetical protein
MYVYDIVDYVSEVNLHAPIIGRKTVLGFLLANGLVVSSFTITGLQRAMNQVVKY